MAFAVGASVSMNHLLISYFSVVACKLLMNVLLVALKSLGSVSMLSSFIINH